MGNWCVKPEEPIRQCSRQLFGRGPLEKCTTNKLSFTWKNVPKSKPIMQKGNLCTIDCPLEGKLRRLITDIILALT